MTWNAYNRRKDVIREFLADANKSPESANPTRIFHQLSGTDEVFDSVADLLLDIQSMWYQRLSGHLDRALTGGAAGGADLEELTILAWSDAAATMPGARALLVHGENMPELDKALANEHLLLAFTAGHPDDVAYGLHLQTIAKSQVIDQVPDTPAGLMARIKEVLAA